MESMLLLSVLCLALLTPAPAWSQTAEEEQAHQQLEVAKKELAEGNFEAARKAADAALRLYPSLYEAMMYKALAYEGLGELKRAKGLLRTFKQVSFGDEAKAVADEALGRIEGKLGEERQAAVDQEAAALAQADEVDATEDAEEGDGDSDTGDSVAAASGSSPKKPPRARIVVPLDMPDYPAGSEEFLSWMMYRQQLSLLELRKEVGFGLSAGGAVLAGIGAGLAGAMVGLSARADGDPTINRTNVEAGYAAGLGATFSGITLLGIGLPMALINAARAKGLSGSRTATAQGTPRLEVVGGALALRF
jgi:tetratricopeptide (TPR) repeat protein